MERKLRVINDVPRNAAFNMAADLYLLEKSKDTPDISLRFYSWSPPCITIGCMQDPCSVLQLEKLSAEGISWIRRPTGGRAVFHKEDLTYSVVFSREITEMGASIAETYNLLSQALMNGLSRSGISSTPHDTAIDAHEVRRDVKLPCFLAPNRDEILSEGRKLVGSAQKRTSTAVLQHGSLPVTPAFRKLPNYQQIPEKQRQVQSKLLLRKCACLNELAADLDLQFLAKNIADGFGDTLALKVLHKSWSPEELNEIEELASSSSFTNRWMK